jgi:hypothetical protein
LGAADAADATPDAGPLLLLLKLSEMAESLAMMVELGG